MSDLEKQQPVKPTAPEWEPLAERVPGFVKTTQIKLRQHHVDGLEAIAAHEPGVELPAIIRGILDRQFAVLGLPTS